MSRFGDRIFMTPQEIYRQLTEGPGPRTLYDEQEDTSREQAHETERAEMIKSLANTIRTGWQGETSEGAYGAAMPLAERAFENAAKLDHSQDLLSRQIGSFNTAVRGVQPVTDTPDSPIDEKFPFDVDYDKAVKDYQDSAQHNIAVFREYDGASHYNETNIPHEYHNNTDSSGNFSVKEPGDTIEVEEPGPGSGEPPRGGGHEDSVRPGSSGEDSPYPGGPSAGGFPAEPGGSETSPSDFRPAPVSSSPVPTGYSPVGQSPVSGGFGGDVPAGGGFGPRGGGGAAGGGPGGVRVGGPGLGAGAGAGLGTGAGLGAGAGAGSAALAAEQAAARRAAQAAAAAGAKSGAGAVGAPVGAKRGKDDEDAEHQRKVLIEADAEGTFGSDELTAPQVIGDDEYED